MHGFKRALRVASAAALAIALAGCGGLGIDLRSGGSGANTANQVAITAVSGVTTNPYPVEIGHTTFLVAHPSSGNVVNYGLAQPVVWNSSVPNGVVLLETDCKHPYGGEYTTTICVFGAIAGTANVNGTTNNGAVGTLAVKVVI
jgi:hypothetical protein